MVKNRIIIVDALRGFALLLIVLIHYVEHFDFFKNPEINFLFTEAYDAQVMEFTFLLISGKAYSIFALLFGLSFFIQMDNQAKKGIDYRGRFAWRMTILLIIGFVHSLIYRGDILHIYALLSLPLILLYHVKSRYLWIITGLLVLQVPLLYHLMQNFQNPDYTYVLPFKEYFREGNEIYGAGSFWEVVQYNFWKGRSSVYWWTINNGRYLQLIALFIIGLILGRQRVFENIQEHKKGLLQVLISSVMAMLVFSYINIRLQNADFNDFQQHSIQTLFSSLINLAITSGVITLFTLTYIHFRRIFLLKLFAAYGKMSLSNYISQAILGVIFFYGFGLQMYRYLGSTWSLILGGIVFFLQAFLSIYWNKKYYYGPLEWFWRCCTNLDFSIRMKREK